MHFYFVFGYQATTITDPNGTLYFGDEEYFYPILKNLEEWENMALCP